MKLTLISPYLSTDCFGLRIMAALLRADGHQVRLLFMPDRADNERRLHVQGKVFTYSQQAIEQMLAACGDSDLMGVTLMTQYYDAAIQLTDAIHEKLGQPVIWGGIHATVRPEEALAHADMVCVGEGEVCLPELARRFDAGQSLLDVPGIWVRDGSGAVVNNGAGPLVADLDSLPFPAYDFESDMFLRGDDLVPFTKAVLLEHLTTVFPSLGDRRSPCYQMITSRGCPFSCKFCGETPLDELYTKKRYLRRRSVDNILAEIRWAIKDLGIHKEVYFCDDTFLSRPLEEIQDFCARYKKEFGLPMYCLASPANVSREKIAAMTDAGLSYMGMGIQSGSERMLKLYNRHSFGSLAHVRKAVAVLDEFKDSLTPYYDFIHEDRFETHDDLAQTLDFILNLPPKARIRVYSMVPFPGTATYDMYKERGFITDDVSQVYRAIFGARAKPYYLDFLIDMASYGAPRPLLRLLASKKLAWLMGRKPVGDALFDFYHFLKKCRRMVSSRLKGL